MRLACTIQFILVFSIPCALAACGGDDQAKKPAVEQGQPSLLPALTSRFPAPDAAATCADTSLRLSFATPPTLGTVGKIQVFDEGVPDMPAVEVDLAATAWRGILGGKPIQLGKPVFVDGSDVVVYLAGPVLTPGHTYFVKIDSGVFLDSEGQSLGGLTDPTAWRFTTVAPAPASPSELTVSLDGTGDFCSIQGAISSVPATNASRVTISVRPGVYREIVEILGKSFVTLRGEDRDTTIIAYANNDDLNAGTHGRPMVNAESSNELVIENLTLHNTTPQDGSQAEALRVEPGDHVILRNSSFLSLQDTLLLSGHVYVTGCYIEGNVDFIWGRGTVFFDDCEIKTVGRNGYNVQSRNDPGQYGYVFVNSRLTAGPGVAGEWLARIDVTAYPGSQVAYIDCEMGAHVNPVGWTITPFDTVPTADLRFQEYGSVDPSGAPVDVSRRAAFSQQLSAAEAEPLREPATVLGGWDPTL